jgi:hypothetical protein
MKLVVASAVDDNGDQIHPRKWNSEFMQLPIVDREQQKRQTVSELVCLASLKDKTRKVSQILTARTMHEKSSRRNTQASTPARNRGTCPQRAFSWKD